MNHTATPQALLPHHRGWRGWRGWLTGCGVCLALLCQSAGAVAPASATGTTGTIGTIGPIGPIGTISPEELKELRARIEALKKDIASTEGDRTEAADALRESERAISEANRELRDLSSGRQDAEKRLHELGRQSKSAKADADDQTKRLERLIRDQYMHRERGFVQMLFSGENPAAAARDLHYASYASRAEARLIENLRASLKALQTLAGAARDKSVELADIETRQRAERVQLAKESEVRRKVMRELSSKIRTQRKEVTTLEQNEKRLSNLILKLAQMVRTPASKPASDRLRRAGERSGVRTDSTPEAGFAGAFATLKGKLRLPTRGELASRFGTPREEGGTTWKGLFIKAAPGEDVKAIAPGRVVFADWMRGFGNLLIVDHGAEYLSIYGNNETVYKQAGENVASGDTIARVGNSGGNPETGLYFEVRFKGMPFDPLSWIKR